MGLHLHPMLIRKTTHLLVVDGDSVRASRPTRPTRERARTHLGWLWCESLPKNTHHTMPKRKAAPTDQSVRESNAEAAAYSRLLECVRTYLEENLPEDASIADKRMFGMDMFMVRGNMFMGIGYQSKRLLARVGEDAVVKTLAENRPGVARCQSSDGSRVFSGTLMIDQEEFTGNVKLGKWFALALAYNMSMEEKEPGEKARKKARK